jgi:hypothetical protein
VVVRCKGYWIGEHEYHRENEATDYLLRLYVIREIGIFARAAALREWWV